MTVFVLILALHAGGFTTLHALFTDKDACKTTGGIIVAADHLAPPRTFDGFECRAIVVKDPFAR